MLINKIKLPIFNKLANRRNLPHSANISKLKQLNEDVVQINPQKSVELETPSTDLINEKRTQQKIQILLDKKIYPITAQDIGELDDDSYIKILQLMKKGMSANEAYSCVKFNKNSYQVISKFISLGASPSQASALSKIDDEKTKDILDLVKKGASFHDAIKCNFNYQTKNLYKKFLKAGYNHSTSSILANFTNIEKLDKKETKALANIAQTIKKNSSKNDKLSQELFNFYRKNPECKLKDFAKYVQEIDFKDLKLNYPLFNKYSSKQFIEFLHWHYLKNEKKFNEQTLVFDKDLTQYLSENYVNSDELNTILTACPLTKREVGHIPTEWLETVDYKEEATKAIYQAIAIFQKNKDENKLAQALKQITLKNAEIEKIGKGEYSDIYKITIEELPPVCLKIFRSDKNTFSNKLYGRNAEVQAGLFLNNHTNRFVKMHFGKVCDETKRDGFLVTQFLSQDLVENTEIIPQTSKYEIKYLDAQPKNYIGKTIIDYGGASIKKKT